MHIGALTGVAYTSRVLHMHRSIEKSRAKKKSEQSESIYNAYTTRTRSPRPCAIALWRALPARALLSVALTDALLPLLRKWTCRPLVVPKKSWRR
jgi:hypothetical protein